MGRGRKHFAKLLPFHPLFYLPHYSQKVYSLPRFAISPGIWPTAVGSFIRICFPSIDLSSPALVTGGGEGGVRRVPIPVSGNEASSCSRTLGRGALLAVGVGESEPPVNCVVGAPQGRSRWPPAK